MKKVLSVFIYFLHESKAEEEEIMYNQISSLHMSFLAFSEIENTNSKRNDF